MNNPLHHTLRERTSAKLLLCRQWIERINFEAHELNSDFRAVYGRANVPAIETTINEILRWERRTREDIALKHSRLTEDGYVRYLVVMITEVMSFDQTGVYDFMPIETENQEQLTVYCDRVTMWRKVVQP